MQVGVLQGIISGKHARDPQVPHNYHSVTGISAGANLAALFGHYERGHESDAVEALIQHIGGMTKQSVYQQWNWVNWLMRWPNLPSGLFDSSPLRQFVTRILSEHQPAKSRPAFIGAVDLQTGELNTWNSHTSSRANLIEGIVASSSIPGLLPVIHYNGKPLVDGGIWMGVNLFSGVEHCKSLGYAEEDIVLDIISTFEEEHRTPEPHHVKPQPLTRWSFSPSAHIPFYSSYLRAKRVTRSFDWHKSALDLLREKHPAVQVRFDIKPSKPLMATGVEFNPRVAQMSLAQGRVDGEAAVEDWLRQGRKATGHSSRNGGSAVHGAPGETEFDQIVHDAAEHMQRNRDRLKSHPVKTPHPPMSGRGSGSGISRSGSRPRTGVIAASSPRDTASTGPTPPSRSQSASDLHPLGVGMGTRSKSSGTLTRSPSMSRSPSMTRSSSSASSSHFDDDGGDDTAMESHSSASHDDTVSSSHAADAQRLLDANQVEQLRQEKALIDALNSFSCPLPHTHRANARGAHKKAAFVSSTNSAPSVGIAPASSSHHDHDHPRVVPSPTRPRPRSPPRAHPSPGRALVRPPRTPTPIVRPVFNKFSRASLPRFNDAGEEEDIDRPKQNQLEDEDDDDSSENDSDSEDQQTQEESEDSQFSDQQNSEDHFDSNQEPADAEDLFSRSFRRVEHEIRQHDHDEDAYINSTPHYRRCAWMHHV